MKISSSLLQVIAVGVTLNVAITSCHKNDVNSANQVEKDKQKEKKERNKNHGIDNCPACGMG